MARKKPTVKRRAAKAAPKKSGELDRSWHPRFLELFGFSLNLIASAKGANVNRETVYRHKLADPEFAAAMEQARQEAVERLEAKAYDRASNQSDLLMIFLLKAHAPERYRERFDVTVKHDLTKLDDEELKAALAIAQKLSGA